MSTKSTLRMSVVFFTFCLFVFLSGIEIVGAQKKKTGKKGQAKLQPTAPGKKTGLIPREIFFGNPDKASARISPDGKRLSFLAPVNGVLNVWVGPVSDPSKAKPVTNDKKRGIRTYLWAYTSNHILYLQDAGGDEDYRAYVVDLPSGKTRNLTPEKNQKNPKQKVRATIQEVGHKFPTEILVGLNDRDARYHDIYRLNIETGDKKLLQKNEGFSSFVTDDDFNIRFASKFSPKGGEDTYKPDGKGGWKKFFTIPQEDTLTTYIVGFDKSGDSVYLIDSRGRNTAALATLDLKTNKKKIIAVSSKTDAGGAMLHPTNRTVQAVNFNYLRSRWNALDKNVAADFQTLRAVGGDFVISSRTLDDRRWIVAFILDNGPARHFLYDRDTKKLQFLFTNRQELQDQPLQKMHPVVIKSRDGLNLVSYLTLPYKSDPDADGKPKWPVPMVLLVHGGPWGRDRWGYNSLHQFLANRGYAVLSVNFRGSTGFGKKFTNAGNREWAGKMHNDLIDAVDWAIGAKVAQPNRIAIMGGSYGGYATLVGLTFTPDKFACGVDIVGPSNILTLLNTIPPYWAPAIQLFKDRVGDFTTEKGKKFLLSRSPLTHVGKIKRPLLIGQGANDPRVKQAESDQIVTAMKKKMLPVTYVLFPDEGHGFARPPNKLAFFAVTEAFLARHLGGRFQAIGTAFDGSTITVPDGADGVPALKANLPKKK